MITNSPVILDVSAIRGTGHDISVTAHIQSKDGVKLPTTRTSHGFQPMMVTVDWKWDARQGRYIADHVMVAGDCYRQDGTVGTHRASTDWNMYGAGDVQASHDLADWLDQLVGTLRPAPVTEDAQAQRDATTAAQRDTLNSTHHVDVTDVQRHLAAVVRLTGAPAIKASYLDHRIIPAHLAVEYVYDAGAGWWKARNVKLSGPRILKPKPDGTIRLGKDWHDRSWSAWGSKDVQVEGDLPEWLDSLVSELRPAGDR
ncbi:hypothetical protein [Streptomyces phage phiSAJS1]|uniref:hypothetical protein n=1 Tax=Streptomyces phage phiSAJS1 TaxID=1755682 RepID=UPI000722DFCF|nr:hypothetical protein AVT91_p69 [Streptomyces phage phiSAJS1]ALO79352.1 hypothetical protein [Streptomyces phage phiSAJS1]